MPDIRLIAIDLDGTLMGGIDEFPLYNTFRQKIQEYQKRDNTVWAVCTGRPKASFQEFFGPMQMMGIVPNFIILQHAYIYGLTRWGYQPHFIWNFRTRRLIWVTHLAMRNAIDEWGEMIFRLAHRVTVVRRSTERLWVRFENEEITVAVADMLKDRIKEHRNLKMFKFLKEIDIKPVPFTKGLAVSELARHVGVGAGSVLTIGDGHNDISMFDASVAAHVACPVNAVPEVMQTIHERRGHIAEKRSLDGVIEILDAFQTGKVRSDLPASFKDPALFENPNSKTNHQHHDDQKRVGCRIVAGLLGMYVVLLAFANFGLIPGVSGVIMLPYRMLMKVVMKVISAFL